MPKRTSYKHIIKTCKKQTFCLDLAKHQREALYKPKSNNIGTCLYYKLRNQDPKQPKPGDGEAVGKKGAIIFQRDTILCLTILKFK